MARAGARDPGRQGVAGRETLVIEQADENVPQPLRGMLTVVGMLLFGGLVLWGLFEAPRPHAPEAPSNVAPSVPDRRLKFVSCDLKGRSAAGEAVVRGLRAIDPDYVFLQGVPAEDVAAVAASLGMQQSYAPENYQRSENIGGRRSESGNCILSKFRLFDAEAIKGPAGTFGVWATTDVDKRRFRVACVHLAPDDSADNELAALVNGWESPTVNRMPIVVAGVFPAPPLGRNVVSRSTGWFDGLTAYEQLSPGGPSGVAASHTSLLFSTGWSCFSGGVLPAPPGGEQPVWVGATSAKSASATLPASGPANEE